MLHSKLCSHHSGMDHHVIELSALSDNDRRVNNINDRLYSENPTILALYCHHVIALSVLSDNDRRVNTVNADSVQRTPYPSKDPCLHDRVG